MSKALRLAAVLAGTTMSAVTLPSAHASTGATDGHVVPQSPKTPASDPIVTWDSVTNNRYLEIYQAGTANGTWADVYPWEGGANQKWAAVSVGYDNNGDEEWIFANVNSNKCLEAYQYEKTGHVDQWSCGTYGGNTRWVETPNPYSLSHNYYLADVGNSRLACNSSGTHFWVTWGDGADCLWK